LIRIGEILEEETDLANAYVSYREALETARDLCAREPGTAQWMGDLTALQQRVDTLAQKLEEVERSAMARGADPT
jgi:hypothetical protein